MLLYRFNFFSSKSILHCHQHQQIKQMFNILYFLFIIRFEDSPLLKMVFSRFRQCILLYLELIMQNEGKLSQLKTALLYNLDEFQQIIFDDDQNIQEVNTFHQHQLQFDIMTIFFNLQFLLFEPLCIYLKIQQVINMLILNHNEMVHHVSQFQYFLIFTLKFLICVIICETFLIQYPNQNYQNSQILNKFKFSSYLIFIIRLNIIINYYIINIQMLKQNDYSFQSSQQDNQIVPIITKDIVIYSKVEIDHLLCPICLSIIWDPVTCGSNGCFSSFCSSCISVWLRRTQEQLHGIQYDNFLNQEGETDNRKCCPKCKRTFKKICIPLLKSLLQCLILRCTYYKNGCTQELKYNDFHNHTIKCLYKKTRCQGCFKKVIRAEYQFHTQNCQLILVKCQKCNLSLIRGQFSHFHTDLRCYQKQVHNKDSKLQNIQKQLQNMDQRMINLQRYLKKVIKGQFIPLKISFYTTFTQHFTFPNVTLIKPSFNPQKQKFDFLHFYIVTPLKVFSPIGVQWKIRINKLIGNLLIGFCSTMCPNSLDYIINKFGQLKKKQTNQSKYKPIRKTFFQFSQGDIIQFRFNVNSQYLKIQNQTKNLSMKLDQKQILEIGPTIFTFISMDTLNDAVSFL